MEQRLHPKMADYIKKCNPIFSIHNHVLNHNHVPDGFLGRRMPWLFTHWRLSMLEHFVGFFGRFIKQVRGENLKYLRNFIDVFDNETSVQTFEELLKHEKQPTIYGLLLMDMKMSIEGKMVKTITQQMDDAVAVRNKYPEKVLLFMAIDPNNPDAMINYRRAFSKEYNFYGVKIYPSLGYLPSHPILMQIFKECEANDIPVIAHCSSCCMKPWYKKLSLVGKSVVDGQLVDHFQMVEWKTKGDYETLNDPKNWLPVLMTYPNLRLNLAHFAGCQWPKFIARESTDNWVNDIIDLMWKYQNVYTDFSYTLWNKDYYPVLQSMCEINFVVANRLLYGTDWYMLLQDANYDEVCEAFKTYMGEKIMNKIARDNPRKFLNI